jgi:parallel beta-helix repeat protein
VIEDNLQYGIRGIGCDATIRSCTIWNNQYHGIFQDGTENTAILENCNIRDNQRHGVYLYDSISSVKNSVIVRNGLFGTIYYGIRIENPSVIPLLHNNTIAYNRNAGIAYIEDDSDYTNQPDIQNCILWYNNQVGNGEQQAGHKVATHYSCVYDPNDPAGTSTTFDANYNFSHKPDFAYSNEPNNIHLAANSFCINKGDPGLSYANQQDIDGEDRVMGSVVDVGADEVNPECDDVYHPLDWNADGVVNYMEFEKFSEAWLTHPSDPHWNPKCDLDQDYDVDLADLVIFADDLPKNWLWVACWRLDLQPELLEQMMSMSVPQPETQVVSLQSDSANSMISFDAPPKPIREQIIELKDTIQFLERIWLNDPLIQNEIDPAEWQRFMDKVYDGFNELKTMNSKTLDLPEALQ